MKEQKELRIESEHAQYVANKIYEKAAESSFIYHEEVLDTKEYAIKLSDLAEICEQDLTPAPQRDNEALIEAEAEQAWSTPISLDDDPKKRFKKIFKAGTSFALSLPPKVAQMTAGDIIEKALASIDEIRKSKNRLKDEHWYSFEELETELKLAIKEQEGK